MTTIAELKAFLSEFPDDANVEVVSGSMGKNWEGDSYRQIDLVLPDMTKIDRYTTGAFFEDLVEYEPTFNGRPGILLLGSSE